MEDEVILRELRSIIRSESRRRMIQTVLLVSFFSWLLLINSYQLLQWWMNKGYPPSLVDWLGSIVIDALFALILALITLGVAYAVSWRWTDFEKKQPPESMRRLESDEKS